MPLANAPTDTPPGTPPSVPVKSAFADVEELGRIEARLEQLLLTIKSYREELNKVRNAGYLVHNFLTPI